MYNLDNHYENIYRYLHTIITDPRLLYLYPFGSTQPENIEIMRDDSFADRQTNLGNNRRGPMFIFYDQEPLNFVYNKPFFDYIVNNTMGPWILINTERNSEEKLKICEHYGFAHLDYFFHIFAAEDWYRGHEFLPITKPADRTLTKTYITFNRLTSNERIYRGLFVNELYKNNLLADGHVSFSHNCPDGGLYSDNLRKGIENQNLDPALVEEAIANLDQLPDLRIDFKDQSYIPNQSMLLSPLPELMESFAFVVTETCYWQNKTHLTEKIFKPIVLQMPFILVGCLHNLEYLRSFGFKTFGDFWDESYDTIEDPIQRLQAVTQVIAKINQMSKAEQKSMLLDLTPILEHNYNLFNSPEFIHREWNSLKSKLADICKLYEFKPPYRINVKLGQAIPIVDPI